MSAGIGIYWLASYPKSGNTWVRVFLQNLLGDADTPVAINSLSSHPIASSRAWLEEILGYDLSELSHDEIEEMRPLAYSWAGRELQAGYHKVHDACHRTRSGHPLFPGEGCGGAIYIVRNPLDIASSFANHLGCTIDEAIDAMEDPGYELSAPADVMSTQTRQRLFDWSGHVESWIQNREFSVHLERYEDMLADPLSAFGRMVKFLGLTDRGHRLQKAIEFSRFKALKAQEEEVGFRERPLAQRPFFRKGEAGAWKSELSIEQIKRILNKHRPMMQRIGYLESD